MNSNRYSLILLALIHPPAYAQKPEPTTLFFPDAVISFPVEPKRTTTQDQNGHRVEEYVASTATGTYHVRNTDFGNYAEPDLEKLARNLLGPGGFLKRADPPKKIYFGRLLGFEETGEDQEGRPAVRRTLQISNLVVAISVSGPDSKQRAADDFFQSMEFELGGKPPKGARTAVHPMSKGSGVYTSPLLTLVPALTKNDENMVLNVYRLNQGGTALSLTVATIRQWNWDKMLTDEIRRSTLNAVLKQTGAEKSKESIFRMGRSFGIIASGVSKKAEVVSVRIITLGSGHYVQAYVSRDPSIEKAAIFFNSLRLTWEPRD